MSARKPESEMDDLEPVVFPDPETAQPHPKTSTYAVEVREKEDGKTAGETAELRGVPVKIPQPHGGALLSGGMPGNKGGPGRPPKEFLAWCKELTDDDDARRMYEARNKAGDLDVMKFAAGYAHGKPRETVELTGKDGGPIEQEWVFGTRRIKF